MADKALHLKNGSKLHWLPKDYKYFFNQMTLIFGASNSGKSVILEEIMFLCKPYIPFIMVIAPTNDVTNTFTGRTPPQCIKTSKDLQGDKVVTLFNELWERQVNAGEAYRNANNIAILKKLFSRISDKQAEELSESIVNKAIKHINNVNLSSLSFSDKKNQKISITETCNKSLQELYKASIRYHKLKLEKDTNLSKKERCALMFMDFNPHCLLILDDCGSMLKDWQKRIPVIKQIFYEGRWRFFTTIITSQSDTEIGPELRKNSMTSIFTDINATLSNFERKSNYYPKHVVEMSKDMAPGCFGINEDAVHFRKLVYIRNDINPFRYTIADRYEDFKMGGTALWEFSDKIGTKKNDINDNNPFFDKYG